jgi:hypothetical protein
MMYARKREEGEFLCVVRNEGEVLCIFGVSSFEFFRIISSRVC